VIDPRRARPANFPIISAALLLAVAVGWLAWKIPHGILTYPDELLTAERSREMLLLGKGTVHFNFRPSFAKPPLQYWLTTLTLPRLANASVAVRIWPLVYGTLTAAAVGWLAWLLDPKRPWLIPLSSAIFISCPLFLTEASRALLDIGLTFFTTLALGFALLARRNPRWWLAVAIVCWLGALQKTPFIFLVWLIVVIVRFCQATERRALHRAWLPASALLAAILMAVWPFIQFSNYHMPLAKAFAGDHLPLLFGQRHLGSRPYFEVLDGLLASAWAGGGFALLAAIAFLFLPKQKVPLFIRELSIVSLSVIALAVICNFRSVRYVLPIVPSLSLILAFFLYELLERQGKVGAGAKVFVVVFVLASFGQAFAKMHHRGPDSSSERRIAQTLGTLQRDGTITLLVYSGGEKRSLRSIAFYLFHGGLRFPLKGRSLEQLRENPEPSPALGVCRTRDLAAVQVVYPGAAVAVTLDEFVCWQTPSAF
jgi:4-amino-4-deoxy-L-arabinose transferase-like glycosyltransferase